MEQPTEIFRKEVSELLVKQTVRKAREICEKKGWNLRVRHPHGFYNMNYIPFRINVFVDGDGSDSNIVKLVTFG